MNNPLSFSSVKLELFTKEGVPLKPASGFVVKADDQYHLITNWHVVSGKHISADIQQGPVIEPFILKTSLHIYGGDDENSFPLSWGMWKRITVQLYDDNDTPTWIELQTNRQPRPMADIIALPLQLNRNLKFNRALNQFSEKIAGSNINTSYWAKLSAIPISAIDTDVEYAPPDTVYIVGYPLNWAPEGTDKSSAAFWRMSSIATEINKIGMIQSDTFFIDPCALEGMTGSPVIGLKNDRAKLLGIYSDRSTAELGANAGFVWDASLLKDLLRPS
jgi:hypothetical protein